MIYGILVEIFKCSIEDGNVMESNEVIWGKRFCYDMLVFFIEGICLKSVFLLIYKFLK